MKNFKVFKILNENLWAIGGGLFVGGITAMFWGVFGLLMLPVETKTPALFIVAGLILFLPGLIILATKNP